MMHSTKVHPSGETYGITQNAEILQLILTTRRHSQEDPGKILQNCSFFLSKFFYRLCVMFESVILKLIYIRKKTVFLNESLPSLSNGASVNKGMNTLGRISATFKGRYFKQFPVSLPIHKGPLEKGSSKKGKNLLPGRNLFHVVQTPVEQGGKITFDRYASLASVSIAFK